VIKSLAGDRIDGWVRAALPFLFWRPLNPNALTVLGTVVSLGAAVTFASGHFVAGGVLILLGGVFDLVDGVVARYHGISTRFGAFLDSTLDRLVDMGILLGIAMYFAIADDPARVLLAGYAMVATVLVSYSKARAELVVASFRVGILERGERVGILAAGAIFGFLVPALWIIAVGSTITVIQRFARAHREMEALDRSERASVGEGSG